MGGKFESFHFPTQCLFPFLCIYFAFLNHFYDTLESISDSSTLIDSGKGAFSKYGIESVLFALGNGRVMHTGEF